MDGLSSATVQIILAEVGTDVHQFPSANHFSSWLGLAPHNEKSGGKILRNRVGKRPNRVAHALRLAAVSLLRSNTALGAYHRRMRAKIGPAQAVVATAHKLAIIIFYMLRDKTPFKARNAQAYDQLIPDRQIKSLERNAKRLGFTVVPQPPPA
ncbi:MAG: IS110 family transposase [Anaerolineae bacterium]|nr:IS110 family transposase [Anaerolineae bacterium]